MQAILLVGGFGTRLHPLTLTTPKQMLPVVGHPMIEHVVAGLARHGVDRVVLSLGYREDVFRLAYPDRCCAGVDFTYAVEPEPLGTAGAIRFAWSAAGEPDETFLVANGDVITDLDVSMLVHRHRYFNAEVTVHLTGVADSSQYGVVVTDDDGRVTDFVEKPPEGSALSRWVNAGTYVMEPSVIDRIPEHGPASVERETFPAMVEDGTLWAVPDDAYWVDAGTPESYLQVQLDLLDGLRVVPSSTILGEVPYVSPDASIGVGARVDRSVVMSGASIGVGARVDRSVVMSGASIGVGARVDRSVVMSGASICAYAVLQDSVLGTGASTGPGAVLTGGTLISADAAVAAGEVLSGFRQVD